MRGNGERRRPGPGERRFDSTAPQPPVRDADFDTTGPISTKERWWRRSTEPKPPRHGRRVVGATAKLAILAGGAAAAAGMLHPQVEVKTAPYVNAIDTRISNQPSASAGPDRSRQPIAGRSTSPDRFASPSAIATETPAPTQSWEAVTNPVTRGEALTDFYTAVNALDTILRQPIHPEIARYTLNEEMSGGMPIGGEMDMYFNGDSQDAPDIQFSGGIVPGSPDLAEIGIDLHLDANGNPITAEEAQRANPMSADDLHSFARGFLIPGLSRDVEWTKGPTGVGCSTEVLVPGVDQELLLGVTINDRGDATIRLSGPTAAMSSLLPPRVQPEGSIGS